MTGIMDELYCLLLENKRLKEELEELKEEHRIWDKASLTEIVKERNALKQDIKAVRDKVTKAVEILNSIPEQGDEMSPKRSWLSNSPDPNIREVDMLITEARQTLGGWLKSKEGEK
jgi:hypothetical protein